MENQEQTQNPLTYAELKELAEKRSREVERLLVSHKNLQDRYKRILTGLPLGLIIVERDNRVRALNKRAAAFFEYQAEELANKPISFLFPDHGEITSNPEPEKWMGKKKSGEIFATEVFVNELYVDGEDKLFISVLDITERHRLEQLRQDLIAMVSHDLRAPLTAIRVVLDMVGQGIYGELKGRGKMQIENAQSSTEYLISLVRDLLDSHKLESGTLEIEKADTSVGKIVKKAMTTVEGSKSKALVNIEVDYTNDAIKADEDRVVQVLINLVTNAVKYSPDNTTVRVTAGMEGLKAKFQVRDEGPGIPKELHTAVFERYRQLEQSSETKKKGFGLGLAICKSLIEEHKGRIWVESEPGKGSNFCFEIPTE